MLCPRPARFQPQRLAHFRRALPPYIPKSSSPPISSAGILPATRRIPTFSSHRRSSTPPPTLPIPSPRHSEQREESLFLFSSLSFFLSFFFPLFPSSPISFFLSLFFLLPSPPHWQHKPSL